MLLMKNYRMALLSVFLVTLCLVYPTFADEQQTIDEAVNKAATEVAAGLKTTKFENIKSVAVLPLWGEDKDGYVLDTIKSHLSDGPYALMARSTPASRNPWRIACSEAAGIAVRNVSMPRRKSRLS